MVWKMDKIKICFVSIYAYPLFNPRCNAIYGGAEVQQHIISKELSKNSNFDVSLVVGDFGQKDVEIYNKIKVIKSFSLKKTVLNYIKGPVNLYLTLKKINPDIIIQRAHGAETGICAFYSKRYNKKFVYSVAHKNDVNKKRTKGIIGKIFDYGLKNTGMFVAQNKEQSRLIKKNYHNNLLCIIKKGLNINKIKVDKKDVLWIGRCVKWKHPEIFLKLATLNPKINFKMICPFSNDKKLFNQVKRDAKKIKNLKFYEFIAYKRIFDFYKKAKVFILTSDFEGDLPMTCLEAMSFGVPILSLRCNPDNVFDKNKIGLFSNGNLANLNQDLVKLSGNKKSFKTYQKGAVNYVKKVYSIKENIKKWKDVIMRIMNEK